MQHNKRRVRVTCPRCPHFFLPLNSSSIIKRNDLWNKFVIQGVVTVQGLVFPIVSPWISHRAGAPASGRSRKATLIYLSLSFPEAGLKTPFQRNYSTPWAKKQPSPKTQTCLAESRQTDLMKLPSQLFSRSHIPSLPASLGILSSLQP